MKPALVPNNQLDTRLVQHASALDIKVGDTIQVKCLGRDDATGALRLSRRMLLVTQQRTRDWIRSQTPNPPGSALHKNKNDDNNVVIDKPVSDKR